MDFDFQFHPLFILSFSLFENFFLRIIKLATVGLINLFSSALLTISQAKFFTLTLSFSTSNFDKATITSMSSELTIWVKKSLFFDTTLSRIHTRRLFKNRQKRFHLQNSLANFLAIFTQLGESTTGRQIQLDVILFATIEHQQLDPIIVGLFVHKEHIFILGHVAQTLSGSTPQILVLIKHIMLNIANSLFFDNAFAHTVVHTCQVGQCHQRLKILESSFFGMKKLDERAHHF
ncbi:hypothetical protein BpHYR1_001193 [Brachionus plicatilis]|uniref:Uncharacterized protein n=1 Tax=Brachionus plicatilis TaxID=10195 RepID=A0A3M7PAF5_BRAPC|nr:hypothetical protein BpHYR1_001193 [Brachionus plicatilis]